MPTLKHLIEDIDQLNVEPDDIRIPGQLYDELVEQAEDTLDEDEEEK